MRKLKWVLLLFVVVALFASCDVWISFWGSSGDNEIDLSATFPTSIDLGKAIYARLYVQSGSNLYLVESIRGSYGDNSISYTFNNLVDGTYWVCVWYDSIANGLPDWHYQSSSESGETRGPITLGISQRTAYVTLYPTTSSWSEDGYLDIVYPGNI